MRISPHLVRYLLFILPCLALVAGSWAYLGSEAAVVEWAGTHRAAHPGLTAAAQLLTDWGNIAFYLVYAWLLVLGLKRGRKDLVRLVIVYIVVQLVIALGLVQALKHMVGRPRPGNGLLYEPFTTHPGHHAMPSGHTTEVTGSALPLALRWRGPVLSAALPLGLGLAVGLMGASRVYLGWHQPADVLFGLALGSVSGLAIHLFSRKD